MKTIDYYYSAHSAYAYLGARYLYDICARRGAVLVHKPFDLSPVVEKQGSLPFHARTQAHVDYFFGRELERWAEMRSVSIISKRPTYHDADYSLANAMIAAAGPSGADVDALSEAILRAHWADDADLSDSDTLCCIAQSVGMAGPALLDRARQTSAAAICAQNTKTAAELSVFGSPTYILEGDMFYGQDHLDMLDRALVSAFRPTAWSNPSVDPA